jgi:tetratricopeptide (TPR) repeat protein
MHVKTKLDAWLNGVIEAGWLAALVVAPLFFNVFSSRVFEPDKISLIRTIALIMLLAWLVKLANGGPAWMPSFVATPVPEAVDEAPSRAWWQQVGQIPLLIPILLLIVAYLLSTFFSVARFVSWWGSYQRLQGTYTFLSYITIALLTMAHLRHPDQIRRIQHVIVLTSLPIALYGVIQNRELDPLPWGGDTTSRVAANAGNAIFLAAYLIMAFFFTVERVYSSFAYLLGYKPSTHAESQDIPTALAGGAYLFVLMVQLLAIFWTQSRGPWLGLFFGVYLFVLLLFTALRPKRHRLWTSIWIGLGVAGVAFLILVNVNSSLFPGLRNVPYLNRLTTLLEAEGGTGEVRVLIWEGVTEMIVPHEPLKFPDGSEDPINALRPLVGYGPEAMWIAYNPFYPPALAQLEARNASPDRAHNETWDSLVITGGIGFVAYLAVFIGIFYWALRWLGLLVGRRDTLLFALLLALSAGASIIAFYFYDGSWRFFGVALPAGLILGLGIYVTLSAFLHNDLGWGRGDLPRQLLIITILATITAHFLEIHFGIAIAASRTYFWIETALLLVVGMRWAVPSAYTIYQTEEEEVEVQEPAPQAKGKRRGAPRTAAARRNFSHLPSLPATVMTDLLIFLTTVFLFTTNSQQLTSPLSILFSSVFQRNEGGQVIASPFIFIMLLFTWFIASTVGLASTALQQKRTPDLGWWLRGYGLHAAVVWGGWLIYGLIQGMRLIPGVAGNDLDSQLTMVASHFALYTWILVIWLFVSGTIYAWSVLRERRMAALGNAALSLGAGVVLAIAIFAIISTVNIALVRADIIYKQGQQFDSQGNWVSSIELYRRALNARRTEDHYMLFLGRALLEQAKLSGAEGAVSLPENPTLNDVVSLTPEAVGQMSRTELLRAAETVLKEAQTVNPLNTDHTANLARLYRSWADLSAQEPEVYQAMLTRSLEQYNTAVTLSPNAAHLWNEKGNAHLARGEDAEAEAAYLHSLSIDERYDQTYLLLADFYERRELFDKEIELLEQALLVLPDRPQFYSYLGVAKARLSDLPGAVEANLKVLELQPTNVGAMRNLAILYRDQGDTAAAIEWVERAIGITPPDNVAEVKTQRQLAAQIYQQAGQTDLMRAQYEQLRQVDPNDLATLNTLYSLYAGEGNVNAAIEVLQNLMALEPDNFQHPLALAQVLQQAGQPENAITYANQALALAPEEQKPVITQLIDTLSAGS